MSSVSLAAVELAAECLRRCDQLAAHSEVPGQITRRFLTPPMLAVHRDVKCWMQAASLAVHVDHAGNLIGRRPATNHPAKILLVGSHLDTVPNAGRYDGILGVMIGIAIAQALGDAKLPFSIDVIGFSEEEGVRFGLPYLGSRAISGDFDPAWLSLSDPQQQTMRAAIEAFGLDPNAIGSAAYLPDEVLGFVEPHIEQGPVLAQLGRSIAAVDAIAGQSRLLIEFTGEPGHAGTTPMHPRADALVSAAKFITKVSLYGRHVEGLRATVGFINAVPNARNVIPGRVELSLDVRHAQDTLRIDAVETLLQKAQQLAAEDRVRVTVVQRQDQPAAWMDPGLTECLRAAMKSSGIEPRVMTSGAGHDAVAMADRFPSAMLFMRQPTGISHHRDEDVELKDVAVAIDILLAFVHELANRLLLSNGPYLT